MLRSELEILMEERRRLLATVGAAAALVYDLDVAALPEKVWDAAEELAESLNQLPEDALREALEAHFGPEGAPEGLVAGGG